MNIDELKWLPVPLDFWLPAGLADFQVGWFMNLLSASLRSETPGFLVCDDESLWRLAGSRHPESFRTKGALVTAAFQRAQTSDGRQTLFFPPLVKAIESAAKRRSAYRARGSSLGTPGENGPGSAFISSLFLDFDSGSKPEKPPSAKKATSTYSQADFDARDLRKLQDRLAECCRPLEGKWIVDEDPAPAGAISRKQIMAQASELAGIPLERAQQLLEAEERKRA